MLDANGKYVPNLTEVELIKALRSGKYNQITGVLHARGCSEQIDGYCCLGVACDITRMDNWVGSPAQLNYLGHSTALPDEVRMMLQWYDKSGLLAIPIPYSYSTPYTLVDLNDSKEFSFDQIADIIEAGLVYHMYEDAEPTVANVKRGER